MAGRNNLWECVQCGRRSKRRSNARACRWAMGRTLHCWVRKMVKSDDEQAKEAGCPRCLVKPGTPCWSSPSGPDLTRPRSWRRLLPWARR